MRKILRILMLLTFIFCCQVALAQSSFDDDTDVESSFDSEDSFDDEDIEEDEEDVNNNEKSNESDKIKEKGKSDFFKNFRFTLSYSFSYGTSDPDTTIMDRASLRCEFDKSLSDIFLIKFDGKGFLYFGNDHISEAEDEGSQTDAGIREFYIAAGFENFTIKAGKQVVVWGETDGDIVNDVVSPRDLSEFMFIELEDSRLGQYMTSLDIYSDYGDILLFVTYKPFLSETPEIDTRYYRSLGSISILDDKTDFSNNEVGFKWKKIFGKFDFSLMAGSFYQNSTILEHQSGTTYKKVYDRYGFYGIGASYAFSNYLIKFDGSLKKDFPLQGQDSSSRFIENSKDVFDSALAIEFDANGKYSMNFEFSNRHIFDYQGDVYGSKESSTHFYYLLGKKFLNETLNTEYVLYYQFHENNFFHKVSVKYDFTDDINFTIDYTYFDIRDEDSYLWNYKDEDRVGVELKYFF
ncbi:MAG: hypothetical protein GY714_18970 [Desulfobacterales bacterium]|nr:hypothetical protein [Desulfobacterales bacterium]